jgi:uncharacterized membrane protein
MSCRFGRTGVQLAKILPSPYSSRPEPQNVSSRKNKQNRPSQQRLPVEKEPSSLETRRGSFDSILHPEPPRPLMVTKQERRSVSTSFSGPLPPPWALQEYDKVVPGAAEKILAQAQSQTLHRIEMERKVTESDIQRSRLGLAAGFIVAMTTILGGIFLAYTGHDLAGTTIAALATASLVGVFVYGKSAQKEERLERAKVMVEQPKGDPSLENPSGSQNPRPSLPVDGASPV